ncbi:hypothetical protein [Siminovitchia sp. 179-K 8D1 HS]|uniref:hypothetical protein n=1 Tax=Siminovitchia sp. 179-K 8D1 HS TaxID=3142385 RepID=UPI0039A15B33
MNLDITHEITEMIHSMEEDFNNRLIEIEKKLKDLENKLLENEIVDTCKHADNYFRNIISADEHKEEEN